MKVRALANLNTPEGPKEIGDQFDLTADKVQELADLGWIEKVADSKSKAADADAKA